MYVKHESRLIDPSSQQLAKDLIGCNRQRFTPIEGQASLLGGYTVLDDPSATRERILAHFPDTNTQLINAQDMQHFLRLFQRRGQALVPFVPSL